MKFHHLPNHQLKRKSQWVRKVNRLSRLNQRTKSASVNAKLNRRKNKQSSRFRRSSRPQKSPASISLLHQTSQSTSQERRKRRNKSNRNPPSCLKIFQAQMPPCQGRTVTSQRRSMNNSWRRSQSLLTAIALNAPPAKAVPHKVPRNNHQWSKSPNLKYKSTLNHQLAQNSPKATANLHLSWQARAAASLKRPKVT